MGESETWLLNVTVSASY